MQFVDATLVRLADPASRAGSFDQESLDSLVAAGYDVDRLGVDGPFVPLFDEFRLGFFAPRIGSLEGTLQGSGGNDRQEVSLRISGLGDVAPVRVDAVWRGSIVGRAQPATSRITHVDVTRASFDGLDEDITAAAGALPTDPALLEQARRARILERLRAVAEDASAVTPAFVDSWLESSGLGSAAGLVAAGSTAAATGVAVTFSPPQGPPPGPVPLPVSIALLIRDTNPSVAQLLAETKAVRDVIEPLALDRRVGPELPRRVRVVVAWVLPASTFDDADWPAPAGAGTPKVRRRRAASKWLSREGIGLVVMP
jgi:hypothetical protein